MIEDGKFDIEITDGGYWEPDPKTGKLVKVRNLWTAKKLI